MSHLALELEGALLERALPSHSPQGGNGDASVLSCDIASSHSAIAATRLQHFSPAMRYC